MFARTVLALPCRQKQTASAVAGALVAYTGVDRTFASYGLGPAVHHALAGVAVDVMCRGQDVIDGAAEMLMSAGLGYAGAMVAARFLK